MNIRKIRDSIPDRATHYDDNGNYYKIDPFYIYIWFNNSWEWLDCRYNINDYEIEPL